MADVSLFVEIQGGIDWTQLGTRLTDAERTVLTRYESVAKDLAEEVWTRRRWKYEGRPKSAPRNVSLRAWETKVVSTDEGVQLHLINNARGWRSGKPYVAHVKRDKNARPEWVIVSEIVAAEVTKPLGEALVEEIAKTLRRPKHGRRRVRPSEGTLTLDLEL